MKILIFVPARGGSKGIPGKNLISLLDKPLIGYTLDIIKELIKNKNHEWIPLISTDDKKISKYCRNQGFNMSYKRPKGISDDDSSVIDAIWHSNNWLNQKKIFPDAVLLLQPTTPIRKKEEILKAINKVNDNKEFSVVSVTEMREHPNESVVLNKDGWSYLSKPKDDSVGRQNYDKNFFFIDGNFYFASINILNEKKSFLIENFTEFFVLNQRWSIDIDEPEDLLVAEALLRKK
jgi:CMP-N,N'-diacetyllegionaminic acid synthase